MAAVITLTLKFMIKIVSIGAIGGIQATSQATLAAFRVAKNTKHVMLVGKGADHFAKLVNLPEYDPRLKPCLADYENWIKGKFLFFSKNTHLIFF